jgi:hypothetical protein
VTRSLRAVIAAVALLLSGAAHAEVLYKGKVVQWTADRIIDQQHLPCVYGPIQQDVKPNGTTVITRSKVCTREGVTR